jgi:RNA polymerase sigma factor (sigma-70 family)
MAATEQSDAQLVARCRAGDAQAWNEFVERFSRYVYAIAGRGFRLAAEDAEDVFQEVFARAFEKLAELRSDDAVRPWLAQLTRRLCIDRLRLNARDGVAPEEPDEQEVDDVLATLDEAMTVRGALDAVGDPCREILDRFFCRDESYRTIGEALEIPAGTIASRISRCLDKVRAELEGRNRGSRPS